jgi:hypothetical protein
MIFSKMKAAERFGMRANRAGADAREPLDAGSRHQVKET